jgi:hypothetical protein
VRLITVIFLFLTFQGCAQSPTPEYKDLKYDFVVSSVYPLTKLHKNIYIEIDALDLSPPPKMLPISTLKLKEVFKKNKSQIVVSVHVANSFLKLRPAGIRKELIFNRDEKGSINKVAIQRAHIRTHYNIEVVDTLTDTLIDQFSGANNYPIEALDYFNKKENRLALNKIFVAATVVARQEVINNIWQGFEPVYLRNIQVSFAEYKYNIVKSLTTEPKLAVAFKRLKKNNKSSAKQALNIYNALLKKYKKLEGDYNKSVRLYIDHGITVSAAIVNNQHNDRFPYYSGE